MPEIASVKISKYPERTKYLLNDTETDLTGGQLEVTYANGEIEIVDMNPDDAVTLESEREGRGKVEFQYKGNRIYFFVDILMQKVENVLIKQMPSRQEYLEGDNLDLSGLILNVTYNDGSVREVTDLDNGKFMMYCAHTQTGVNLTYEGCQFNIPVIVRKPEEKIEMVHVFLATPPAKEKFIEGDLLDFTGAQLMLQYSNGTRELVDVMPDMIKSGECSKPGETTVVIEYQGYKVEETLTVYARNIDHLEIVSPPKKTKYIGHEPVDAEGLVLGVCFNNGDREETKEFTVLPEMSSLGMNAITIQYRDHQIEFPVTVEPVSITKLDWESLPEKRNYFVFEKNFQCFGGVLRVKYNTGEIKSIPLSADMIVGFNTDEPGQCTIVISYGEQELPFTITVQDRQLLGIQIKQKPRTFYMAGERFNPEGMKVEAIYSGGSNEEVEFTFRPDRLLRPDDNFVVIAYKDKAAMLDLTVTEPEPDPEPAPEPEPITDSTPDSQESDKETSLDVIEDVPGVDKAPLEEESEVETRPVQKIEVPHFYPSTFCIRFQDDF